MLMGSVIDYTTIVISSIRCTYPRESEFFQILSSAIELLLFLEIDHFHNVLEQLAYI